MAFVSLSKMPSPPATRVVNIPSMSGGLNIHDLPWQLAENQSPEMKNMWWEDGALRSRPGQYSLIGMGAEGDATSCAAYSHPYHGHYIFHRGTKLWAISEDLQSVSEVPTDKLVYTDEDGTRIRGLPEVYGTFVLHNGLLYYKTRKIFTCIRMNGSNLVAYMVDSFCPTYLINADPGTPGAGDLYQPLNRLNANFYVTYSPKADKTTDFYAPFYDCAVVEAEILDSTGAWVKVSYSGLHYNSRKTRGIRIKNEESIEAGQNNVRILFTRVTDTSTLFETQYNQLMSCTLAAVYGGGSGLCMVLAGCEDQPNAWFWSANTDLAMDPTYFPMEHYNLAGDFSDPITALGQQQNKLILFQRRRIGAAQFGTTDIDGRTFITMNYSTVNPRIGCDVPGSVQLIENNLVFANKRLGVMLIRDTTSADENNLARISDNIECSADKPGLLYDLQNTEVAATSVDDGERYWLVANGHAWLWDYRLGESISNPKGLSWFYFDNINNPVCWFGQDEITERCYVDTKGKILRFTYDGEPEEFEKVLALPVLNFGTYEVLKNVTKAIFVLQGGSNAFVDLEYRTDYSIRTDAVRVDTTAVNLRTWQLTPRNMSYRSLKLYPYAVTAVRKPRCLNTRHFQVYMRCTSGSGYFAFVSAQIYYTMQGVDR